MLVLVGVCVVVMRLGGVFVGDEVMWVRRSKVRACVPFCEGGRKRRDGVGESSRNAARSEAPNS